MIDALILSPKMICESCGRASNAFSPLWTCPECGRAVCANCMADYDNGWRCHDCANPTVCSLCLTLCTNLECGLCPACAAMSDAQAVAELLKAPDEAWDRLLADVRDIA